MNKDVFESMGKLSNEIFSKASPIEHIKKMQEEGDEVIKDSSDIYEYVDCLLALCAAMYKSGFKYEDIITSCSEKIEVLKNRKWIVREDGIYQHIK